MPGIGNSKCQKYGPEAAARYDKNLEEDMQQLKQMQFLGHNHITVYFKAMTAKHFNLDPRHPMACVLRYFDRQWIHGKFPPSTWSQFKVTIRSNNGVEGWHKNSPCRPKQARREKSLQDL